MCGFFKVLVCVCVGFLKCWLCMYGFCNLWVCGFCNVWLCVCVGFVMCGLVMCRCVCVCERVKYYML